MFGGAVGGSASGMLNGTGMFSAVGGMGDVVGHAPAWDSGFDVVDGPLPSFI